MRTDQQKKWLEYSRRPERVKTRKEYSQTETGKTVIKKAAMRWQKNNPEKVRAQRIVRNELRRGRMIRPTQCEDCNFKCHPHGHHDDYDKPLKV